LIIKFEIKLIISWDSNTLAFVIERNEERMSIIGNFCRIIRQKFLYGIDSDVLIQWLIDN
jgi:hypothetical protein